VIRERETQRMQAIWAAEVPEESLARREGNTQRMQASRAEMTSEQSHAIREKETRERQSRKEVERRQATPLTLDQAIENFQRG